MRIIMFFAAVLLFAGGPLMAEDTSRQGRLASISGQGQEAMTQEIPASKQHIHMLFERVSRGEIDLREAMKLHREKFHDGRPPDFNSPGQQPAQQAPQIMRRPDAKPPF